MKKGFTIIELLVVIAIIGVLASILINTTIRGTARARDGKRIQQVYQISHALNMFYSEGYYPDNTDSGDISCTGSWDAGNTINGVLDTFIQPLIDEGFLELVPIEDSTTGSTDHEECSYKYMRTDDPCGCTGTYAILYATCETNQCPVGERPDCCSGWAEGGAVWDDEDITIFLKQ